MFFDKFFIFSAIFFIQVSSSNVWAKTQEMDGHFFLKTCTATPPLPTISKATVNAVHCLGYIRGFVSALQLEQRARVVPNMAMICLPDITYGQARDVFIKFLRTNPESLNQDGGGLLFVALHKAYPCKS